MRKRRKFRVTRNDKCSKIARALASLQSHARLYASEEHEEYRTANLAGAAENYVRAIEAIQKKK